jgi:hypothetical protein
MEIPPFDQLPVKFNHWGELIQRGEFQGLMNQRTLLCGLQAYAWHRIRPGGFLQAALANDFKVACAMADFESQRFLTQIAAYIHNHMPDECNGSRAAIEAWLTPPAVDVQLFATGAREGLPQS